jgi:ParB family chromosome partitioning protein
MSGRRPPGLGRGMAALMGDAANAPPGGGGVQSVPLEMLTPSPFQPRKSMDEGALAELAQSIRQRGILQPLLVRPAPGRPGHFQIIAGERRWRAAQSVPLHEVPVMVRALSDSDAMAAGLVENLQRADLNPIEEAEGYQRLISEFQMTQEALGEAVGKSRSHVTNTLRILKLPAPVLAQVRAGALSMGHARALLGLADPVRGAEDVIARGLSVRQTEEMVETQGRGRVDTRGKPQNAPVDADIEALARRLTEHLGLSVKISFDGRRGMMSLAYQSLDQLDSLLALLER